MYGREYLKDSITLYGQSGSSLFEREFTIIRVISEGADGICYEAYHDKSGKGVLKEFYPVSAAGAERDEDGRLEHASDFRASFDLFRKNKSDFIRPYEMLLDIRQNSQDTDISTFIPAFELYSGGGSREDLESTVYVWTPEPELVTFDVICDEIHRHPGDKPEHKLVQVLTAAETLTKCICALHKADIIHRDIKPSNFGFVRRGGETLMQAISMFDIDSLCSLWADTGGYKGTAGFMEPEALYEDCTNQTDIYSIGATLFTALVVNDETRAGRFIYSDKFYGRLKDMVDSSELILASEANAHPRLRSMLTRILRKCLCSRSGRYESCEELLDDIRAALFYALPSDIAKRSRAGEKWVLSEADKALDRHAEKNSYLMILYHLYEKPLYMYSEDEEDELRIAVSGFDSYAQKFLDACLQTGQMRDRRLHISVFYDDDADREIYLAERPQLGEFFNIDGSLAGDEADSYGEVEFIFSDLGRVPEVAGQGFRYLFISTGDDAANRSLAGRYNRHFNKSGSCCMVSYVCEEGSAQSESEAVCPVFVNNDAARAECFRETERMAFNTHMIWGNALDSDEKSARKMFRKSYNHDSSTASVISLKYKLKSLGIDLGGITCAEAAAQYAKLQDAEGFDLIRNQLMWIEHRRWVAEKLCAGWRGLTADESNAGISVRDEKRKRHICILRSRPDRRLHALSAQGDVCRIWDELTEEELGKLDEIDRMSVLLHRMYRRKASGITSGHSIYTLLKSMEAGAAADPAVLHEFREWRRCIESLRDGSRAAVRSYRSARDSFISCAEAAEVEGMDVLTLQARAFDEQFRVVPESLECREWKQEDAEFIDNIPFILTDTDNKCLVIPYDAGSRAADRYSNVAAASHVMPSRIVYLYRMEEAEDISALFESVSAVTGYAEHRKMQTRMDFVLLTDDRDKGKVLGEALKAAGRGRIRTVLLAGADLSCDGMKDLKSIIRRAGRNKVLAVEVNDTELSESLRQCGIYEYFPSYEFDAGGNTFTSAGRCEAFCYIRRTPVITASEMISLSGCCTFEREEPEFMEDHDSLWKLYCRKLQTWETLCDLLRSYSEQHDTAAVFTGAPDGKREKHRVFSYRIPAYCRDGAVKILRRLKEEGLVSEFRITACSAVSCSVEIRDAEGSRKSYDRVFSDIYILACAEMVMFRGSGRDKLEVIMDDLMVRALGLPEEETEAEEVCALLGYLSKGGYVNALEEGEDCRSTCFTYASAQTKRMLTSPDYLAALHVYHELLGSGEYDDVAFGLLSKEASEADRSVRGCLVTRGTKGQFIAAESVTGTEKSRQKAGTAVRAIPAEDIL